MKIPDYRACDLYLIESDQSNYGASECNDRK